MVHAPAAAGASNAGEPRPSPSGDAPAGPSDPAGTDRACQPAISIAGATETDSGSPRPTLMGVPCSHGPSEPPSRCRSQAARRPGLLLRPRGSPSAVRHRAVGPRPLQTRSRSQRCARRSRSAGRRLWWAVTSLSGSIPNTRWTTRSRARPPRVPDGCAWMCASSSPMAPGNRTSTSPSRGRSDSYRREALRCWASKTSSGSRPSHTSRPCPV
jgi:hypothetical protein